jgi:hypothetical protein
MIRKVRFSRAIGKGKGRLKALAMDGREAMRTLRVLGWVRSFSVTGASRYTKMVLSRLGSAQPQ